MKKEKHLASKQKDQKKQKQQQQHLQHKTEKQKHHKEFSYKLSSSFKSIHQARKNQTFQYIQQLAQGSKPHSTSKYTFDLPKGRKDSISLQKSNEQKHSSLKKFKFNLHSSAIVSQVPVQILRKNSKSKQRSKLQSLADNNYSSKFSIFDHQKDQQEQSKMKKKDPKQFMKKYNIGYDAILDADLQAKLKQRNPQKMDVQEQQVEQGMLKPSKLYEIPQATQFFAHTIFQTPLLPCFASQFNNNLNQINKDTGNNGDMIGSTIVSKKIQQKQGVWKIGKIKIKGKRAEMKIGQIQFNGQLIDGQGKSGVINGNKMFQLKDWKGIWIMQPKDELFQ